MRSRIPSAAFRQRQSRPPRPGHPARASVHRERGHPGLPSGSSPPQFGHPQLQELPPPAHLCAADRRASAAQAVHRPPPERESAQAYARSLLSSLTSCNGSEISTSVPPSTRFLTTKRLAPLG